MAHLLSSSSSSLLSSCHSIHVLFALCTCLGLTLAGMDITAFEYQRTFGKTLSLGECPYRKEAKPMINGTVRIQELRCTSQKKGSIRSLPRPLSESRNELIEKMDDVVLHLGLCRGESASYLGILLDGDCVASEIANRLRFGPTTVVRAFIGDYRTSLDILDTTTEDIRDGMETYYKDKYYVKYLSYGTLEIIFVQMRFRNRTVAALAKEVKLADTTMSAYMTEIHRRFGDPKSVTVISLSTALKEKYQVSKVKEWDNVLRDVRVLELKIKNRREEIMRSKNPPHLKYELFPFLPDTVKGSVRLANPIQWENITMQEIKLKGALKLVRRLAKKANCKRNKIKVCQDVRKLRIKLRRILAKIHKGRSAWINLTADEKASFIRQNSKPVETKTRAAMQLAKNVRKMKRAEKRARLYRKRSRNSLNEIPSPIVRSGRQHRIRHFRRKYNRSKNAYMGWK